PPARTPRPKRSARTRPAPPRRRTPRPPPPRPPPRPRPWPRPPPRRRRPRRVRPRHRRTHPGLSPDEGHASRDHRYPHLPRPGHLRVAARHRPPQYGTGIRAARRGTARHGHGVLTLPPGFRAVAGQLRPRPPGGDQPAAGAGP